MESAARVYVKPVDVTSRLAELGLTQQTLLVAMEYGLQYVYNVTEFDPPGAAGSMMWFKTVRGLREGLVPQGWKPDSAKNYETVIHPSGSHSIAVIAGNAYTGNADKVPSTMKDRGPATRLVVEANYTISMWSFLGDDAYPRPLRPPTPSQLQTWILLHCIDRRKEEVRYELSLALEMDSEGFVKAWRERIIFPAIPFSREPMPFEDTDEPDIDFPVERKVD